MTWILPIGAQPGEQGTRFRVWAPSAAGVRVLLYDGDRIAATHELRPESNGYFSAAIAGVRAGARYRYQLDERDPRPDPASRFQPLGVHGPSQVVDPASFAWTDEGWSGVPLEGLALYELHVGAATPEGTFAALIERLDDLRDLGVTAIELLPVADFPGERNWGYDGVNLFAPARAYGEPDDLRRLVDAAHARGLAVFLDVVYNHFGPDGNYLRDFSPEYFTHRHTTPWGDAVNVDGQHSGPVRAYFIANACYWAHEFHIDGLRLDATHAIVDDSPVHVLREMVETVHASLPEGRRFLFIAENEHNDPRLVRPVAEGGLGLDGVWADDFHHEVRVALAGDKDGYFRDYSGSPSDLARTLQHGWFYTGQASVHLGRPRGHRADDLPPMRFVHCIQNHDQVGNRALGGRLNNDIGLQAFRMISALLLLSPYTPLLWMGQEWAASTPFLFFTDHNDDLGPLVTAGRREEFAAFVAFSGEEVPDPQAPETFRRSKLRWDERAEAGHAGVLALYRDLLALRRERPALRDQSRERFQAAAAGSIVLLRRASAAGDAALLLCNLRGDARLSLPALAETAAPEGSRWSLALTTEDPRYGGQVETARLDGDAAIFTGPAAMLLVKEEQP